MKVTGILAAAINDTGVVGVDPWCHIRPFKIFGDNGYNVDNYKRALAIDSAVAAGAAVISCSWKAKANNPTAELEESIIRASDSSSASRPYTCVFFFGTGNDNGPVAFPASMSQTIAVGAVDGVYGGRCSYSNYGTGLDIMGVSDCVGDVCDADMISMDQMGNIGMNSSDPDCVGGDIPDLDYTIRMNGTSAACPQAAAVAALLLSRADYLIRGGKGPLNDTTTSVMVRYMLTESADDLPPTGWDQYTGYGRINAWHALLSVIRGDVSNDGLIDSTDLALLIDLVYFGGHAVLDDRTGDCDCNGDADSDDLSFLIDYVFFGGPLPGICFEY